MYKMTKYDGRSYKAKEGDYICVRCKLPHWFSEGLPFEGVHPSLGKRLTCPECFQTLSYGTRVDEFFGGKAVIKDGFMWGCEFESHVTAAAKAVLTNPAYGLVPTSDCSIEPWISGPEYEAVEWKMYIRSNSSGLRKMLRTWIAAGAVFDTSDTGQHIHFSRTDWDEEKWAAIRRHAAELFLPLEKYMVRHPEETEKVFGRYFSEDYADATNGDFGFGSRYVWLNANLDGQMELRIAKFRSIDQYKALIDFCREFLGKIETWFFGHAQDSAQCAEKLIELFKKYAAGEAATYKQSKFKD